MSRAFILVLDSFGIGASADADKYGDVGANTLKHIAEACAAGLADQPGLRQGSLHLPFLNALGLNQALKLSCGETAAGLDPDVTLKGAYGYAVEQSLGKDTPSGHWEMAGVPILFDWGYFPTEQPCFPQALTDALIQQANLSGILGNCHASGTTIIDLLGPEHMHSGKPIVYTSADSVLQIAAHEETFGLQRLYDVCEIARVLVDDYNIARVIARPFIGTPGAFKRTANRRDLATPPPEDTLLDHLKAAGREVLAVGKIADIFAHRGMTQKFKGVDNMDLFDATLLAISKAPPGSLVFSNFVDFDSHYGHRRDIIGYAHALECFDQRLVALESVLQADDMVILTADHGCDPTHPGTDHTREHIPILMFGPNVPVGSIGRRETFADIGQTVAKHLKIAPLAHGTAFL